MHITCDLVFVVYTVSYGSHNANKEHYNLRDWPVAIETKTSTVVCQIHARRWPQPALLTLQEKSTKSKLQSAEHQSASAASQIQRCATVEVQIHWNCYCYYHWQQNAFCDETQLNIKKLSSSIHIKDLYEAYDNSSNAILWPMPDHCSEPPWSAH